MNIYKIRTCRFTEIEFHGNVVHLNYEISEDQICIMDPDTRLATDIFTNEEFYVLGKEKTGRIASKEKNKINLEQKYGTDVKSYDMNKLGPVDYCKTSLAYLKTIRKKSKDGHQKIKR